MATSDDSVGSELPALTAEQEAAFAAEESAASAARAGAKGLGHQRLAADEPDVDEPAPAPAPKAPDAPAVDPKAAAPAAPAPAAPAAEPDEDVPEAVTDDQGRKYVPVATLVATRKSLRGQLKDAQTIIEEGSKRLNVLLEIAQKQAGAAPPAPKVETPAAPAPEVNPFDKATHPLEHLEWKTEQAEKRAAALEDWRKNQETTSAQTQAMTEARTAYVTMHRQFVGQNPAYDNAYRHVMDTWTAVNRATGMTQPEAIRAAEQLEWQVVERAVKANQHPSAMLMEIAKAAGWKADAPAAVPAAIAPGAAPAAPAAPDPAKQIKLAQQGAAAAVSLSDAAGGAAPAAMTLAQLAALPKEEFHARFAGAKGEEEFRKLAMGTRRQ